MKGRESGMGSREPETQTIFAVPMALPMLALRFCPFSIPYSPFP